MKQGRRLRADPVAEVADRDRRHDQHRARQLRPDQVFRWRAAHAQARIPAVKIDNFKFSEEKPARKTRFLYSLVKGGLRAVTGIVGKRSKRQIPARHATATIGIRGTDLLRRRLRQQPRRRLPAADCGRLCGVADGEIVVRNGQGELGLTAGQFGLIEPNQRPLFLSTDPGCSSRRRPRSSSRVMAGSVVTPARTWSASSRGSARGRAAPNPRPGGGFCLWLESPIPDRARWAQQKNPPAHPFPQSSRPAARSKVAPSRAAGALPAARLRHYLRQAIPAGRTAPPARYRITPAARSAPGSPTCSLYLFGVSAYWWVALCAMSSCGATGGSTAASAHRSAGRLGFALGGFLSAPRLERLARGPAPA